MQKHHFYYILFLVWLSYLITSSLLLFMKGFLLTRVVQPHNSSCLTHHSTLGTCPDQEHCAAGSLMDNLYDASRTCLPQRAKVVLLVVDALRHDFAAYDPDNKAPLAYQNKLTVIRDALRARPDQSRLYRFVADPPTTTMQRLKALTTGSLPTFIDAGANFATPEINEDNLIDQLRSLNKQVVFMGDDTWTGLYPNRFIRTYDFPSFNVFDLDTVDNGVKSHLFAELASNDWDLLIGHFLGVDHCGHRYGPTHKEMERKLLEMNQIIGNVMKQLDQDDENTVLFVIGDHGMTAMGDHGGESEDEVTAAMFVYSKLPLVAMLGSDTTIKQVDLVPTLSTILGVPIPYLNLGSLVLDALPDSDWQSLLVSLWSNVQQMTEYINEYASSTGTFGPDAMRSVREKFSLLNARVRTIKDPPELSGFARSAGEYMAFLRRMCEEVWVKFDSFSMSRGLLLSFLTIFFVYLIISGIPAGRLPEIFVSPFVPCSYVAVLVTAIATYFVVSGEPSIVFFTTGIVSVFMLAVLVVQNWAVIALHWYGLSKKRNFTFIVYRVCLLFGVCCLFSNSYIVEEDKVSLFLTLTTLLVTVYDCDLPAGKTKAQPRKPKSNKQLEVKVKLVMASTVLAVLVCTSTLFWKCREEQNCLTEKDSNRTYYILTLVLLGVFVTASRSWLKVCGNLTGFSLPTMVCRYCPTIMVVCTGGFWALRRLPKEGKYNRQADLLVWAVYVSALLGLLTVLVRPLRLYILPDKSQGAAQKGVAYLFNRIKGLLDGYQGGEEESGAVPVVYGLATVYSSAFFVLAVLVSLFLALLVGDVAAASLVILTISAGFVLVVMSMARYEKITNTAQLFDVPNSSILVWFFFSIYFFYGTGHQPAFPNIQWEAAFLGTGEHFNSNFIPGALIVANTFGSYFLMGLTLPLVLIAPFALYSMFPGLSSRKSEMLKDCSRGEVVLYENYGRMLSAVFVISCKYILLHCLRVFASMLSATIHCRHLMVWKVFAPKLIFESVGLLVTVVSVLAGYLFLMYVNHSLHKLVMKLRTTPS